MVYTGVSTGCGKCRERHIKCDETKPACQKCLSRGYSCPGFRGTGGLIFRDVSKDVSARQVRRAQRTQKLLQVDKVSSACKELTLPTPLTMDPSTAATYFFFRKYILSSSRNPFLSRGHFDHLLPLYVAASPSSPLSQTVAVMARRAMSLYLGHRLDSSKHIADEAKAAQAIRNAITDPRDSLRDETLLAVLCMDFAEHITSRATSSAASRAHIRGALALIQHRGAASFQTDVSRSLLAGTMSNALLSRLWFPEEHAEDMLALVPDIDLEGCSPVARLHQLLVRTLKLENEMTGHDEELAHLPPEIRGPSLLSRTQQLYGQILKWTQYIPPEWQCLVSLRPHLPISIMQQTNGPNFPLMQVAYVVGQWYCTRLTALRLVFIASDGAENVTKPHTQTAAGVKAEIERVLDGLDPILQCLRSDPYSPTECVDDLEKLLERSASSVAPAGADDAPVYIGGTSDGRHYLLNLLNWALSTFDADQLLDSEYRLQFSETSRLQTWLEKVLDALNRRSHH